MKHFETAVGANLMAIRRWLDISHRAIGRLAKQRGIEMHESLWATWEQRAGMVQDEARVHAVLRAIAECLEGDPEKLEQMMFDAAKGERELPKKLAPWKPGMKPVLVRGRRPGSGSDRPSAQVSPAASAETEALKQLATEIAVDYATKGEKLPEKVGALIQRILSVSAKRALGAIAVVIGLAAGTTSTARAAELSEEPIETSIPTAAQLKRLRGKGRDEDSSDASSSTDASGVFIPHTFTAVATAPSRVRKLARAARNHQR